MFFYIVIGAYLIGVNIAGLAMLFIQKKEKNLSPCERSFSDTNSRTDTEKAAINYAAKHSENAGNIGNAETTKSPVISTYENENTVNADSGTCQNNSAELLKDENAITIKVNIPKEKKDETKKERKKRLKEEKKAAKQAKDKTKKPVSNFTIILLAALGGALLIYAGMFFMKYKLKSLAFMLTIPTIIGLNIYVVIKLLGFVIVWTTVNPPV